MQPLDPAVRTVWTIKSCLFWVILLFVAIFVDILWTSLPFGVLSASCLIVGALSTTFVPGLRYRFWRYDLRPEELYLERGIWNRVRTIVPLRRIQHLDVSQDLVERNYELGRLIVHTAGSRSSDVVLPGLRYEVAEYLRDTVKQYITEDAL